MALKRGKASIARAHRRMKLVMEAWAGFRALGRETRAEDVWGHLFEFESASHERSPPH